MTEVTRVPLQPVAKGSLTKIWLGVVIAVLLGAGLAFAAVPKGFSIDTIVEGTGPTPEEGDMVFVKYRGSLAATGEVFDESQDIPLPVAGVFPEGSPFPVEEDATIEGFYQGLQQMRKGGRYELYIPADMAYGAEPPPGAPIPPNADLVFEIEVVDFMSREMFDRNLGILQRAMQSGLGAGPGAAPSDGPQTAGPGGAGAPPPPQPTMPDN
ncbi:FKBP-type peptidyl-prolyl cis-trans isomerase [Erythrobacter sp.]|jgi:FKBP-type peptidyl-prolyl cis-trans isomerase FkpA|uniref:FKBP-type peptidyl-prolyl cis-trans isomerase n=1 Tax=Erythrobacter sp. TaxID=1042 RepID=UPI002ECC09DF|nr:FKBP-type peptidyl-prolyl cis-trans isomerase [Erythrobacter sp.]